METVIELENSEQPPPPHVSSSSKSPTTPPLVPVTSANASRPRNRTDSLKLFTDKFRSISSDLLRSIESAHEMIDLNRSHFSAATQLAAVQQYQCNENYLTPTSMHNKSFKSRANTVAVASAYKHEIASDSSTNRGVKTGSINDVAESNLPSTSCLSSLELANEQPSGGGVDEKRRYNSLSRGGGDSPRKKSARRLTNNSAAEDASSNRGSYYYTPKSKH